MQRINLSFSPESVALIIKYLKDIHSSDPKFIANYATTKVVQGRFFHNLKLKYQMNPVEGYKPKEYLHSMDVCDFFVMDELPKDLVKYNHGYIYIRPVAGASQKILPPMLYYVDKGIAKAVPIQNNALFYTTLADIVDVNETNYAQLTHNEIHRLITQNGSHKPTKPMIKDCFDPRIVAEFIEAIKKIDVIYDEQTINKVVQLRRQLFINFLSTHEGTELWLSIVDSLTSDEVSKEQKVNFLKDGLGGALAFGLMNILIGMVPRPISIQKQAFLSRIFHSTESVKETLKNLVHGDQGAFAQLLNQRFVAETSFIKHLKNYDAAKSQDERDQEKAHIASSLITMSSKIEDLFTEKKETFNALKDDGILEVNNQLQKLLDDTRYAEVKCVDLYRSTLVQLSSIIINYVYKHYSQTKIPLSLVVMQSLRNLIDSAIDIHQNYKTANDKDQKTLYLYNTLSKELIEKQDKYRAKIEAEKKRAEKESRRAIKEQKKKELKEEKRLKKETKKSDKEGRVISFETKKEKKEKKSKKIPTEETLASGKKYKRLSIMTTPRELERSGIPMASQAVPTPAIQDTTASRDRSSSNAAPNVSDPIHRGTRPVGSILLRASSDSFLRKHNSDTIPSQADYFVRKKRTQTQVPEPAKDNTTSSKVVPTLSTLKREDSASNQTKGSPKIKKESSVNKLLNFFGKLDSPSRKNVAPNQGAVEGSALELVPISPKPNVQSSSAPIAKPDSRKEDSPTRQTPPPPPSIQGSSIMGSTTDANDLPPSPPSQAGSMLAAGSLLAGKGETLEQKRARFRQQERSTNLKALRDVAKDNDESNESANVHKAP